MNDKVKWTFMVYLAGDNNLSTAGEKDLTEMRSVGSTQAVNVVVEFDNAGDRGTNRYLIQRDGIDERVVSLGETDSGDPGTLIDFVEWAADEFPAERYALILWNHGSGWAPTEIDRIARGVGSTDYNPREAAERSATPLGKVFFRTTMETIFSLPTSNERAICSDDGSGHSLDTIELGKVLANAVEILGQPLDLLGMDACLMSNLEVAYQAQPYARYIVASEENEPGDGWPYEVVLRRLVDDPEIATPEFAAHIVNAYVQSYVDRGYPNPVTQSALDLSRVKDIAALLDDLGDAIVNHMPEAAMELWTSQRKSTHFWHMTLWDITHFCEELESITSDDTVRSASRDVIAGLQQGQGSFIVAEAHNGAKVERCGGSTIYFLPPLVEVSQYYTELEYAKDHGWLTMLKAYHAT